jgi:hypothetical protein
MITNEKPIPKLLTAYGTKNTHKHSRQPYDTIDFYGIVELAKNPASKEKGQAQFCIFSAYHESDGRTHKVQADNGQFHALCIDVDTGSPSQDELGQAIDTVCGSVSRIIYSTASATPDESKWRVIIPLASALPGRDYCDVQTAFFGLLHEQGIECDPALARPGQPIYLPNVPPGKRGENDQPLFYEYEVIKGSHGRLKLEGSQIEAQVKENREREEVARAYAAVEVQRKAGQRAAKYQGSGGSLSPIDNFCKQNSIENLLTQYGYERQGNTSHWRSPYQESGSYATQAIDGHWTSLSDSDRAAGLGGQSANGILWGDAFDLFLHYEHSGDRKAALKAARSPSK